MFSCEGNKQDIDLKTKRREIKKDFNIVNLKSKTLLLEYFSNEEFENYFKLNEVETCLMCNDKKFTTKDSIFGTPSFYRMTYDFIYRDEIQESIDIDFDSLKKVKDFNRDLLLGFRQFIDNKLKISRNDALKMAAKYEINGKDIIIYFKTYRYPISSPKYKSKESILYYWHISKECDNCNIIQIDAISGKVFSEGKYKYIH
jgi:hypothetical protein